MNNVDIENFFNKANSGDGLSVKFKRNLIPIKSLNINDQKTLENAKVWLNVRAIRESGPYNEYPKKGVLISLTKISETYYVYEKIVNEEDKPVKGNSLVKDEVTCRTYISSFNTINDIIKSIKKYCPEKAHEFIELS